MNKSILEVVHEGAKDLHQIGFMDDMTMREFDALCLPAGKNKASQSAKVTDDNAQRSS